MLKTSLSKFAGLLFLTSFLFGCGNVSEEGQVSKVKIKIPQVLPSQKIVATQGIFRANSISQAPGILSDIWSPSFAPTSTSELNCFGVMVGADDINNDPDNFCEDTQGEQITFGVQSFGVQPGSTISLEVDSGAAREIRVIGWKAENDAACTSLQAGTNIESKQLSHPFVIATDIRDLDGGDQNISITASLTGAKELVNCKKFAGKPGSLSTRTFTISGTVTGNKDEEVPGDVLIIQLNGSGGEEINGDGPGTLPDVLGDGVDYNVTVLQQPAGKQCTVVNGTGTINGENIDNVEINCVDETFNVGGEVFGLAGFSGQDLILGHTVFSGERRGGEEVTAVAVGPGDDFPGDAVQVQGPDGPGFPSSFEQFTITQNGSFTLNQTRLHNESFDVFVLQNPLGQSCFVSNGFGTINDADVNNIAVNCSTNQFPIGGDISGLIEGRSITLRNVVGSGEVGQDAQDFVEDITITNGETFIFNNTVEFGENFNIGIVSQPIGETCTVSNGSGIVSGPVFNVSVVCIPDTFTVGGNISGLISGRTLFMNLNTNTFSQNKSFTANGSYTFESVVSSGQSFTSTITSQPVGQTCTLTGGSGTPIDSNITNLSVVCVPDNFSIGVDVSGLISGRPLTLQNNGGNNLVTSNSGTFLFSSLVASGQPFDVTILNQPPGQTCTVDEEISSGTVLGTNVLDIPVNCVPDQFTVGGNVTGLVLDRDIEIEITTNEDDFFSFIVGNEGFTSGPINSGATFSLEIVEEPNGQSCTFSNQGELNDVIIDQDITNIAIVCVPTTVPIRGTLSGLISGRSLTIQNNGGDNLTLTADATYEFSTEVSMASDFDVTVLTQPAGQTCTIANASGTVPSPAPITNVDITCVPDQFTVGGNISGVAAGTVEFVITTNGEFSQTIDLGNGSFTSNPINSGETFSFALVGDGAPGHLCGFQNASGVIFDSNITNINVICSPQPFTIGGTVVGHPGESTLTLQNNGGDDFNVSFNGSFTMPTAINSGSTFDLTVLVNPPDFTCTVSGGSGTVVDQNITTPVVTCIENLFNVTATVTGLAVGEQVEANLAGTHGGNSQSETQTATSNGSGVLFYNQRYFNGETFTLSITTQPASQTCTVSGGTVSADTGQINNADFTSFVVSCTDNPLIAAGTFDSTFNSNTGQVEVDTTSDDLLPQVELDSNDKLNITFQSFSSRLSACRVNLDGSFDSSWNGGSCAQFLNLGGQTNIVPNALAVDSNDQMVVAGSVGSRIMFVSRLLADGSAVDTSFASTGIRAQGGLCSTNTPFTDQAAALAIDGSNGNIYAAGTSTQNGGTDGLTWMALLDTGAFNTNFSSSAQISGAACIDDNSSSIEDVQATTFDGTGRLLTTSRFNGDLRITRHFAESVNPSSAGLDTGFNGDGRADVNIASIIDPANTGASVANDIITDASGNIYIAGQALGSQDAYVMKILDNGDVDTNFGSFGAVVLNQGGNEQFEKILIDAAGNIVAVGFNTTTNTGIIARYTSAGVLDTTFASGGVLTRLNVLFEDMVIDSQGNIYAVGRHDNGVGTVTMIVLKVN